MLRMNIKVSFLWRQPSIVVTKWFDKIKGRFLYSTVSIGPLKALYTLTQGWQTWAGRPGAKTINVFWARLDAQLTICAHKWRNFICSSTGSLRFVWSQVCVFLCSLGPWSLRNQLSLSGKHSSNAEITKTKHSHFHHGTHLYSWVNWGDNGENEHAQVLKQQQRGFEPGLSRLRVWHSTAELTCSKITW